MMTNSAVKGVLFDIAGVLTDGDAVIPGAHAALRSVRAADLPFRLVTNTTRRTKRAVVKQLQSLGFCVSAEEVFTGTEALVAYLRAHELAPYLLIHPALDEAFADLVDSPPSAVVVGDAADRFTYSHLNEAFRLVISGAPLLAIAANRYFKDGDALSLDAGPFVAALEYAAG
ncbi:MAG: TIGR01458 family HAD-type hydrolase, partial [Rhodospirillales bacterium]|nr:TIGR01458 family HAD-type hydrolase [Rhodospirillales bacterium]